MPKYKNVIYRFSLIFVLLVITGCTGDKSIESLFAPNSELESSSNPDETKNVTRENNNTTEKQEQLPLDFPKDIPIYDSAELVSIDEGNTTWLSSDPINLISDFYQQQLTRQEWNITTQEENLIEAQKESDNRALDVSFSVENGKTKFIISQEQETSVASNPQTQPNTKDNTNKNQLQNQKLPPSLEQLVKLDILSIPQNQEFKPYDIITRRQYARWLLETNNLLYTNTKSKLIRLANPNSKPIFTDVPTTDPDFEVIQGLAEAGLIPSSLTQDTSAIAFNPNKPLNREDLIAWKVPLDFRQKMPTTTLDSIQQTWGFQDASKTTPSVWSELYTDWQNGENANIRKAFGYTTLFQPQKPVTYEEAAEVLSSFGYQTDVSFLAQVNTN